MKIFDRCPDEVRERAEKLIEKYHSDLRAAGVSIDFLFVSSDGDSAALTHGGYAAYAVVRIVGPKDRAKGLADAEIVIDRDKYEGMSPARQDALLDHELYHLEVKKDKYGAFKCDDHMRPQLKMRKHDYQLGWFEAIARRHGEASIEVAQARTLYEESGQSFFGFLAEV